MGQNTSRLVYLAKRKEKKKKICCGAVVAGVAGDVIDSRSAGNID